MFATVWTIHEFHPLYVPLCPWKDYLSSTVKWLSKIELQIGLHSEFPGYGAFSKYLVILKYTDSQTLELFCAPTLMDTKKVRSRQMPTGRCCSCTKPYRWSRFDALYTEYTRCKDCRTTWELKVKRALKLTMKFLKNGGNPFYTASFLNRA